MLHKLETLLTWAVLFGILIFIHELGHFLAAKAFKFKVYEFAFGLPFGKKWRYWHDGETEYTIRAVLLGGFVGFAEAEADEAYYGIPEDWEDWTWEDDPDDDLSQDPDDYWERSEDR